MTIFNSKKIGISLQENTLVMCETSMDYMGKNSIESINLLRVPRGILKNGRIIQKKAFRSLLLEATRTAKPQAMTARDIVFEVPEEHTFQHILTMPSNLTEEQIREAVIFEVEKLLPFELNQLSWDIKIIPSTSNTSTIIFCAIQLELIQEYYDVFISAGFLPIGFSLHFENIYHSILNKINEPSVIIDVQNKYTSLLFLRDKNIVAIDQISIGEDDFKNSVKTKFRLHDKGFNLKIRELEQVDIDLATVDILKKFDSEIEEVLKTFKEQNEIILAVKADKEFHTKDQKPTFVSKKNNIFEGFILSTEFMYKVFQNSTHSKENGLIHKVNHTINNIFNLETRIKNQLGLLKREDKKNNFNRLFPNAYGASLANYSQKKRYERPMNLLPLMVRSIAIWKETSVWFYMCASLILIASIIWLMIFGFQWGSTFAQLRVTRANFITLERQLTYKKSTGVEAQIIKANEELKVLTALKSSKNPYSDIFSEIQKILPSSVFLESLSFGLKKDKTLFELKAISNTRQAIIDTHQRLMALPFTDNVGFPPANLDKRTPYVFSMEFSLKPGLDFTNPQPLP